MIVLSAKNVFPACLHRPVRQDARLKNAAVRQRRRDGAMGINETRNSINHVILNRLMTLRYQLRKRPALLQCIIFMEALIVRAGLIFYGRSHKSLHGKG